MCILRYAPCLSNGHVVVVVVVVLVGEMEDNGDDENDEKICELWWERK